uniref:Nuclease SbcCD subunit C n=1 Tax=Cyanothece sp. (strain PCC 7425 / ATCC 29141) TaxID=395961 RepID=B8HWC2_CYAP4
MEILSVTLKNFKVHSDREFTFQPGMNAICGVNGAGKTSILEAIAWVLFDYYGYSKTELIKSGCASAQVAVTFTSNADGRPYRVSRCTSKGYDIYDPQLKVRLGVKRLEDVSRWLRQHLGVGAETELSKLFAETIGIPQGTFTSDFLKTTEGRKRVFDPILKVEEYKQAFQKASELDNFARLKVTDLQQQLAQYDLQLADWPELEKLWTEKQQEINQDRRQLRRSQQQLSQLETQKEQLLSQQAQLQQLNAQLEQLTAQIEAQQSSQQFLQTSLDEAEQAVQLCQVHQPSYLAYQQATATLTTLQEQWQQQQALQHKREQYQQRLNQRQREFAQAEASIAALQTAKATIAALEPLQVQQLDLEQQLAQLDQTWQEIQTAKLKYQTLQQQKQQQQREREKVRQEIERLNGLQPLIDSIPQLEQQRDRLQQQLSRVEAAQQFQSDLIQIVQTGRHQQQQQKQQVEEALALLETFEVGDIAVGVVKNAIATGFTLNHELLTALDGILVDLQAQVDVKQLQHHLKDLQPQLNSAYQAKVESANLNYLAAQLEQLNQQIATLTTDLAQSQLQVEAEPGLHQQREQIKTALTALDNPAGQIRVLQQQLQQEPHVQQQWQLVQQQLAKGEQAIAELDSELAAFTALAEEMQTAKQTQQQHQTGYQTYLQQMRTAEKRVGLQTQMEQTIAQLTTLQNQQTELQARCQQQQQAFEPQQLEEMLSSYEQLKSYCDQLSGGLRPKQEQVAELERQLAARQALAQERDRTEVELQKHQQIYQFIGDARQIYNKSGPRITSFYLQSISAQADRLFRELLNRPDVNLEWTEDYEIRIQEAGHWRSFKSLSGGEQMCAALAVRLSLLKVLADIDIAFFDEPTTNMDRLRRTQLAEALGNLRSFRQLFVISHDDTFEHMTENVIRVEGR